ncbi:hypothetical protein [Prauserella cavernicola]|uniref:ABC transporter n=1 Tax=Prauserella cavernicola TaxID=2800127 RepID=A0A934QRT6_9PSEU|nr:hypothetical protein [Prauserella cavernicola]MBK1784519.1 hypothetical protein [Prauserella cavernicola]
MIATTRYQLALLAHSQRYLPPLIVFLAVLGVLYTSREAPVLPEFAVSGGALVVVTCWLAIALADVEDPVQRLVTLSHTGRRTVLLAGLGLAILVCGTALAGVSMLWATLVHGGIAATELGWGALAHAACAFTGLAVGLPCSRLLVPRAGYTVVAALLALAVVLVVRWVPLVNPMLRQLAGEHAPAAPVLTALAASAVALVVSATATTLASAR